MDNIRITEDGDFLVSSQPSVVPFWLKIKWDREILKKEMIFGVISNIPETNDFRLTQSDDFRVTTDGSIRI
jgi:hypothetical protein